jgi:hypothetical protein
MIDISKGIQDVIVQGDLEAVVDVSSYHASTHKYGSEERKFNLKKRFMLVPEWGIMQ